MKNFFNKKSILWMAISVGFVFLLFILFFFLWPSERQREKGAYEIARDPSWYPLNLLGKEQNLVGFSNDLLQDIARKTDFHYEVFTVGPNVLMERLDRGNYDAVFSSLTPNAVTERTYVFSDPIYLFGPVLIVKIDSNVKSMNDMQGKILGIPSGTTQIFDVREYPDVLIVPYENLILALEDVNRGKIDGVVIDALVAYAYTKGFYTDKLKVVSTPLTNKALRLVALKTPRGLRLISKFNKGLELLRENGAYEELLTKWRLIEFTSKTIDPSQ